MDERRTIYPMSIEDEPVNLENQIQEKSTTRERSSHGTESEGGFFSEKNQKVSSEIVEAYHELDKRGPIVGKVPVKFGEKGELRDLEVRIALIDSGKKRYSLCEKDSQGELGYITLLDAHYGKLDSKYESKGLHPESYYDDPSERKKDYLLADIMKSNAKGYSPGIGTILHRIAQERSFQAGFEGRVGFMVGGLADGMGATEKEATSAIFHRRAGYVGKDVYKPGDNNDTYPKTAKGAELHHTGTELTQKIDGYIAKETARLKEVFGENIPKDELKGMRMRFMASKEIPYMVLPPEEIRKAKERIKRGSYLTANFATTNELLAKHGKFLAEEEALRMVRDKIQYESKIYPHDYLKVAEVFDLYGDKGKAKEYFLKAYDLVKDEVKVPGYGKYDAWNDVFANLKILIGSGELETARRLYPILHKEAIENKTSHLLEKYAKLHPELTVSRDDGLHA